MKPGRIFSTRIPPTPTRRPSIVLVAHEDRRRSLLTDLLECDRHAVQVFGDGRIALQHIERHRIDVILTETRMPEFEGGEFLTKVRERRGGAEVIVMSGGAGPVSFLRLSQLGATEILANSFPLEELLDTVRGMVSKRN